MGGKRRGACGVSGWGNKRERDHLADLVVDGRIILKWILRIVVGAWTELIGLGLGTVGRLL